MAGKHELSIKHIESVLRGRTVAEILAQMEPDTSAPSRKLPVSAKTTLSRVEKTWQILDRPDLKGILCDPRDLPAYQGNIENAIGSLKVPLGIVSPLRINGLFAKGDYSVPLATTEAALVASYHRGANLITEAGGASTMVLVESLTRSPSFTFQTMAGAGRFAMWALTQFETLQEVANATTSHGQLNDVGTTIEGNHVYLNFDFTTADASGQNMVTIATQAICDHILAHSPVPPTRCYVEANLSGDKKASARSFTTARGKKVTAEVVLNAELVRKRLHCSVDEMCDYWRTSAIGGVLSGTMGIQGHFANGLAALYLATGQDVACVAESAVGVTRFEKNEAGDLYATVTLPGIMVGTVGGGTGLPTQNACLQLMNLAGPDHSRALAEVTAGLILGGELSIIGALAAGHFCRAHKNLARGKGKDR
jgi:hydroxymethylglutaryl-CoA reductase (NADPH)